MERSDQDTKNKLKRKLKTSILFYAFCLIAITIILELLLKLIGMQLRMKALNFLMILSCIGLVVGVIQTLISGSKKAKIVTGIIAGIIFIIGTLLSQFLMLLIAFLPTSQPEHTVIKDGTKYVAEVSAFLSVNVSYYKAFGPFFMSDQESFSDYFGKGGYDPFDKMKEPIDYDSIKGEVKNNNGEKLIEEEQKKNERLNTTNSLNPGIL